MVCSGEVKYEKEGGEEDGRAGGRKRKGRESNVTQLIKLRVDSGRPGNRTDQSGFEEGRPAVDQTPLPSDVVLDGDGGMGRKEYKEYELFQFTIFPTVTDQSIC